MPRDEIKIAIASQQLNLVQNARLGNNAIERAANGEAFPPKRSIKLRGFDVAFAIQIQQSAINEHVTRLFECMVHTESLKHFSHDRRARHDLAIIGYGLL